MQAAKHTPFRHFSVKGSCFIFVGLTCESCTCANKKRRYSTRICKHSLWPKKMPTCFMEGIFNTIETVPYNFLGNNGITLGGQDTMSKVCGKFPWAWFCGVPICTPLHTLINSNLLGFSIPCPTNKSCLKEPARQCTHRLNCLKIIGDILQTNGCNRKIGPS